MFKICMKNYFANLKYVFVALGVMFIALIIGAQTTVNKTIREVNQMVTSIEATTESSDLSFERIGDSFTNTWDAIKNNITPDVITGQTEPTQVEESIGDAITGVVTNYLMYFGEIVRFIAICIAGIIVAILLFFVIQILGVFASSILITMFGRYDIHHDNIFRIILEQLARIVFLGVWLGITGFICYLNLTIGLIVAAFIPLVFCYIVLFSAWLTAGDSRRPKYGTYVTFVNMLVLLACNILQILISAAIGVIIYFIGGIIVAAVFGVALLVLAAANANLNAYAFLYRMPEIQKAIENDTTVVFVQTADAEEKTKKDPQITVEPTVPEEVTAAAAAVAVASDTQDVAAVVEEPVAAEAVKPSVHEEVLAAEAAVVVESDAQDISAVIEEPVAAEPKKAEPVSADPKDEPAVIEKEETVTIKIEE